MDDKVSCEKKKHYEPKCFCCCIGGTDEEAKFHQKTIHHEQSNDLSSEVRSNIDPVIRKENDRPHVYKSDKESSSKNLSAVKSSSDTMVHRKINGASKCKHDESPDQGDAAADDKEAESNEAMPERRASKEAVRRNTLINSGRSESGSLLSVGRGSSSSSKKVGKDQKSSMEEIDLEDFDLKKKVKIQGNEKKDTALVRKKKRGFFSKLIRVFSAESHSSSEMEVAKDVLCLRKKSKGEKCDGANSDNKERRDSEPHSSNEGIDDGVNAKRKERRDSEPHPNTTSWELTKKDG